jgi:uncharacterized damage-inducible protein DinB
MTNRAFQKDNDDSRERLARLVATLTPAQLRVDIGEGWTVGSALAHTGFWDRWQAERWEEMLSGKLSADDASLIAAEHLANDALHPYWAAIDSKGLPQLALDAAARLDALIASAPDELVDALEGTPSAFLVHRYNHRTDHLDHIERSLSAAGVPVRAIAGGQVDRSFNARNASATERLRAVVERLTPDDLARATAPSEEGSWTVGQTLGHLAFWDRFMATRWQAALAAGGDRKPGYLPDDLSDLLNAALEPSLAAFSAESPLGLLTEVVAAAQAIDRLIASLPAVVPIGTILDDRPRSLDRSLHRHSHMDDIEGVLLGSPGRK